MNKIKSYLDKRLISFFKAQTRDEVIEKLVDSALQAGYISDTEPLLTKVKDREKIISTGIGLSTALPHAKSSEFAQFFIAIGILSKGVDWQALDDHPVRLVFLIAGPDDKQQEYLEILSSLTTLIKNEDFRKKLLTSNSPEAMINFFNEVENGSKNQ